MPKDFFCLPGEIRIKIYSHLLVHNDNIDPWDRVYGLSPNILATSKITLHEARLVLYGCNCFNIFWEPDKVEEFFKTIGLLNARLIRSIRIAFPLRTNKDNFNYNNEPVCEDFGLTIMKIIIKFCANVKFVTFSIMSIELLGCSSVRDYALIMAEVDSRLREIPALEQVIVEFYGPGFALNILQEISGLGWLLCNLGDGSLYCPKSVIGDDDDDHLDGDEDKVE